MVRIATGCNRLRRRVDTGCNTRTLRNTNAPPTSRRVSQTDLRPNKSRAQKGRAKVDPLLLERRHPGASLEAFPRGPRLTADSSIEDETRSQGGGHLFSAHHRSVGASPASPRNWSFLALDEGRAAFVFPPKTERMHPTRSNNPVTVFPPTIHSPSRSTSLSHRETI